ncbi:hypothetical protein [Knoellia sp. Soil729]|uniref:hypothetical protein n=1 Tax=Knoellia sp. Soil729 TaxID=1736394 RepID=UPI000A6C2CA3|nr:hypothetical protein [Knoellia sp. Soil729]
MSLSWEGEDVDAAAARRAAAEHASLLQDALGEVISIANEFAEARVRRVDTRNGSRLLIESPKSGQWVALDSLELEALTWQTTATFSAMIGNPFGPLFPEETGGVISDGSMGEAGELDVPKGRRQ